MEGGRQEGGWAAGEQDGGGRRALAASSSEALGEAAERCKAWAEKLRQRGLVAIKEDFNRLRTDKATLAQEMEAFKAAPANLKRHATVTVWDETRVKLRLPEDKKAGKDFIHANYARGPFTHRDYIMTQGPLPDTVADFWGMVVQEKVGLILMLCRCEEETKDGKTKSKSEQYWPPDSSAPLQFPSRQLTVTNEMWADVEDPELDGIQLRQSQLYLTRTAHPQLDRRPVTHLQMRNWSDMDVPSSSRGIFRLIRHLEERETELRNLGHMAPFSPILIHCSAGVGRSGTLVALIRARHILLRCPGQPLDLFSVVLDLRRQRHMSVQMEAQYVWLHTALLDLAVGMKLLPAELGGPIPLEPEPPHKAPEEDEEAPADPPPAKSEQTSGGEEGGEPVRPVLRRPSLIQPSQLSVPTSALPLPKRQIKPRKSPVQSKSPAKASKPHTAVTKTLCSVLRKPTKGKKNPKPDPNKQTKTDLTITNK